MRKTFLFNMMTLDGFFAGPAGEIDWHNVDREFNDFAVDQLKEIDTLIFGRITYELMASYWPTPKAVKDDPVVADRMNNLTKVVFSRTLQKVGWNNSRLVRGEPEREVSEMKNGVGRSIAVFGSANLAACLLAKGLLDEIRLMVNPVILGRGIPLFRNDSRHKLRLTNSRTFRSGNVLLTYETGPALPWRVRTEERQA